jgi:hypothetical protein
VVSNNGKKTNVLEIVTAYGDELSDRSRRYRYHVTPLTETPRDASGISFREYTRASGYQHTAELADRFNAKRLDQLWRAATRQIAERDGIVWRMVEKVLLEQNLTLVTNEPIQEPV